MIIVKALSTIFLALLVIFLFAIILLPTLLLAVCKLAFLCLRVPICKESDYTINEIKEELIGIKGLFRGLYCMTTGKIYTLTDEEKRSLYIIDD